MDQELIAYLDEQFRETSRQIQDLREETTQQIQELRKETTQQIQELRKETSGRFDRVEQTSLETDIKVEALRGDIQQVAEGVAAVDQKLTAFRNTAALEFSDIRSAHRPYYEDLNRRVRDLELRMGEPGIQS